MLTNVLFCLLVSSGSVFCVAFLKEFSRDPSHNTYEHGLTML